MAFCPCLRPEVGRVTGEDGALEALHDGLLDRRVGLGPVGRAVVARLDGRRPSAEVIAEAAAEAGVPAQEAEHALRTLLLMGLVIGAGDWVRERAAQVRAAATLPVLFLEGTRFGCQGSGDCCQSYSLGPLSDEDVARIEALAGELPTALPQLGPGPYLEARPGLEGPPRWYLKTVQGRCVFLLETRRCGLHVAFGAGSKPGFCRLYPYQHLPTVLGLKLYDGCECACFGQSARSGPFVDDELERVLPLLPAVQEVHHPLVWLDDRTPCDYGHLLRLQEAMAALCEREATATATLMAQGELLRRFLGALRQCPMEAGEPDRTVERVLAEEPGPPGGWADERAVCAGLAALAALAGELAEEIAPSAALADRSPAALVSVRPYQELARSLDRVRAAAERATGEALGPPAEVPLWDEVWRLSLRQQVFGHRLLVDDRPTAGFLRIALGYLVAAAHAGERAEARGAACAALAEINAGHKLALRMLHQPALERVFLRHSERVWEVLAALPLLR
ncbi:MAG: YkgJ family cysteine cluster protein [Myxococcales bacterium]|nr:YkgJ family cysteine cluster protein [Myxococcota bacterium]MDW8282999.1 YkgJ family cysteine cluster protein [Myxococcales bacterium]